MLLPEQIKAFFEQHQLFFAGIKKLPEKEIMEIYNAAGDIDPIFGQMFLFCFCNLDEGQIETNYESWDELYTSYCHFTAGCNSVSAPVE